MASFIQPVRPVETVPWGWNPGQTFVDAFNETRLAKEKAEEMRLANELESFLIPLKQKKAAFDLDRIQYETELQSMVLDRAREAQRQSYQNQINQVKSGAVTGGPANAQTPDPRNAAYGLRNLLSPPAASTPATTSKKPSWKVVRPATPAATPTGP